MRTEAVPDILWPRLSELMARTMGLHFPPERQSDLKRGLAAAAQELGFETTTACANWLLSTDLTQPQLQKLASHLTIGETYFFRERRTFEALESRILPELIRKRFQEKRLRLWSAACASGEEPYSLVILLHRLLPQWRDWKVTVLATDINERFLKKATTGVYGEWSFRDVENDIKESCFTRTADKRYAILPEIRDSVTFSQLNLVQDGFPSLATDTNAMDLILCRNVLIYFTQEQTRALLAKLRQALVPEGWLAVSPSECSQALFSSFVTENFPGAILYRKSGEPKTTAPLWMLPPIETSPAYPVPFPYRAPPAAIEPAVPVGLAPVQIAGVSRELTAPPPGAHARALANDGRLAEARIECERWIAERKLEAAAHYLHAMVSQELGDPSTARQSLQRTLYLDPAFVLAHFALGNLARSEGRSAESLRHFSNTLELLKDIAPGTLLPESDGLTAGRLTEIVGMLLTLHGSAV